MMRQVRRQRYAWAAGFVASLVAVGGVASAGTGQLRVQVSLDGASWSDSVTLDDGGVVLARFVMTWVPAPGDSVTPIGLAGIYLQPTFSNVVTPGDEILAFANKGTNANGGSVVPDSTPLDGPFGRLSPWAAIGPSSTLPYRSHVHVGAGGGAPSGSYFRIARSDITLWIGGGTTSAVNNFTGAGGVYCNQKSMQARGASDPPFESSIAGVEVCRFGLRLGRQDANRDVRIDAPTQALLYNTVNGLREARWFTSASGTSINSTVESTGAMIHQRNWPCTFATQPASAMYAAGETMILHALNNRPDAAYRWRRNGLPLADDARISGSRSSDLRVMNLESSDSANYDCEVTTGACGVVVSTAASVVVVPGNGGGTLIHYVSQRRVVFDEYAENYTILPMRAEAADFAPLMREWPYTSYSSTLGGEVIEASIRNRQTSLVFIGGGRHLYNHPASSFATTFRIDEPLRFAFEATGGLWQDGMAMCGPQQEGRVVLSGPGVFAVSEVTKPPMDYPPEAPNTWVHGRASAPTVTLGGVLQPGEYTLTVDAAASGVIMNASCTSSPGNSASARLTVQRLCLSDVDRNGRSDAADVPAFIDLWQAGESNADCNLDGGVDFADLSVFFEHWQSGC